MQPVFGRVPQQEDVGQVGPVRNNAPVCNRCSKVVTQETLARDEMINELSKYVFLGAAVITVGSLVSQGVRVAGPLGGVMGLVVGVMVYIPASVIAQSFMFSHLDHAYHHKRLLNGNA